MKNTIQKIKVQTMSSITKGCVAAICIYTSENTQLTSQSNEIQKNNFSNHEDHTNRRETEMELEDNTNRTEMLMEMMEYDEAHWI